LKDAEVAMTIHRMWLAVPAQVVLVGSSAMK